MATIELTKFEELASQKGTDYTKAPYRIPAKDLDDNFKKLMPVEQSGDARPYTIDSDEDGWTLVPEVLLDICENGKPVKYKFVCQRATGV